MRPQTTFLIVGVLLFVLGLGLALYEKTETYGIQPYTVTISKGYPYQAIGVLVLLIGCGFASLGIYQQMRKKV